MNDELIIQGITFHGHCGITREERRKPQPIMVDLELECQPGPSLSRDDITQVVDYAGVIDRVIAQGVSQEFVLIESLAEHVSQVVLAQFPIRKLRLWARKISPPLGNVNGSVGVRISRVAEAAPPSHVTPSPPAPFLVDQLHRLPKGLALDVATGYGRNALYLATQGFSVVGIDRDEEALTRLKTVARDNNVSHLRIKSVDLESNALPDLGTNQYEVLLVFFYLYRPLFPALIQALKPGGVLVYETFLIDNHLHHQHPRRTEFCLAHNELLHLLPGLRVLHYDEGEHQGPQDGDSAFTARLLAQKPTGRG